MTSLLRLTLLTTALLGAAAPAMAARAHAPSAVTKFAVTKSAVTKPGAGEAPAASSRDAVRILAVVNGAIITNQDVQARARLFAASTGLSLQPEATLRLRPQILRQLISEKLRMQAVEAAHIVVRDKQIAEAMKEIEQRNGLPAGGLRAKLTAAGVDFTTMIDQVRSEIGWMLLLRDKLGDRANVTDKEVTERVAQLQQQVGKPEYRVGEIFLSLDTPAHAAEARKFADTVIQQLRSGAAFPVVAAQFSESQSALQGGDRGWVQPSELDAPIAKIVQEMPAGAVSEPIPVPGGLAIVHLAGKRAIGRDMATVLSVREIFMPFGSTLNPEAPTPEQIAVLQRAEQISAKVRSCPEMERMAAEVHSPRAADPGPVRLDQINPPTFRTMLASLPVGKVTKPLVATDGIALMIVCSREEKNLNPIDPKQVKDQILEQRADLLSRQLLDDLRRKARIELRGGEKPGAEA